MPGKKLLRAPPTTLGFTPPINTGPGGSGEPTRPPPGGGASGEGGSGGSGALGGKPPTLPTIGRTGFGKSEGGNLGGPPAES